MKSFNYFLLSILLLSCNTHKKISVLNQTFITDIGIYFLTNDSISKIDVDKLAKDKLFDFKQLDSIPDSLKMDAYSIKIISTPSANFTPPNINSLTYFGRNLTDNEKLRLQDYKSVLSIVFRGTARDIYNKQKRIAEFVSDLVKNKDVIVSDFNSYEWFNVKSWFSHRIKNFNDSVKDITHQISIHTYRTGEYCRAVTMGMDKFCLPDISIKDFSCKNQNSFGDLINSVIQTLAESHSIYDDSTLFLDLKAIKNNLVRNNLSKDLKKNAKGTAKIKFKTVKPEEGDSYNKQFLITFENPKYSSPQEEQEQVIVNLFGADDAIKQVKHDALLLATSEKARQRLPELKNLFDKGLAPGYSILVKAPFKIENGGNEWMWVEITKWTTNSITGILQNDPFNIKNLKAGAIVNVNEKDIFDYILYKPDGSSEGNETGKIIEGKN